MAMNIKVLKRDEDSKVALSKIFDPENIKACANYGAGDHCNQARVEKKLELWGKRGEDETQPLKCHLIFKDGDPAAMLNIGAIGNPATVIDRTHNAEGQVLEISGAMVRDMYLEDSDISAAIKDILAQYSAPGYSKAFITFRVGHMQQPILENAGGVVLDATNTVEKLGDNAFHPERFKFKSDKVLECTKWNSDVEKVSHEGWHDSRPCVDWVEKTAMVFEVSPAGNIEQAVDL